MWRVIFDISDYFNNIFSREGLGRRASDGESFGNKTKTINYNSFGNRRCGLNGLDCFRT